MSDSDQITLQSKMHSNLGSTYDFHYEEDKEEFERLKQANKVQIIFYKAEKMLPIEIIWRFESDYELKVFLASIYNIPYRLIKQIKFAIYEHFGNRYTIDQPRTVLQKSTWHHFKDKMNTKRRLVFFIEQFIENYLVEVLNIDGD